MKDTCSRVEGEILIGSYPWGQPASRGGPFNREHVVCEVAAEDEFFGWDKSFGRTGFRDGERGGVDTGESGEGGFLGLDAVGALALPWCEDSRGEVCAEAGPRDAEEVAGHDGALGVLGRMCIENPRVN